MTGREMAEDFATKAELDARVCAVCGERVALSLRGYMQSLLACATHLREWNASTARADAILAIFRGHDGMNAAFDAWAATRRRAR